MPTTPSSLRRVGTAGLILVGLLSQESGASISVLMFPHVGALGMNALRIGFSAILLLVIFRPHLRGYHRADWLTVIGYGLTLAVMNGSFYLALSRLHMGTAVTIEMLGPLILSVVISRKPIAWMCAGIALLGVILLGHGDANAIDPLGLLFICIAGAAWACYIIAATHTGRRFQGFDGLAIAMTIGALLAVPAGLLTNSAGLLHPGALALGAAVALLSSVVPYSIELFSLRRIPESVFSILMSLAPAVAAAFGAMLLHQHITPVAAAGIACVIIASATTVFFTRTEQH